jgi:hypothetical protein
MIALAYSKMMGVIQVEIPKAMGKGLIVTLGADIVLRKRTKSG